MKPLAIDLFSGLGGWAEGFLAEDYDVIGFDIERRPYPAQLVLQDVLTLDGAQFRDAAVIVASPPCQAYSYRAMPWKRAKALPPPDNTLFDICFKIQAQAIRATGKTCEYCHGSGKRHVLDGCGPAPDIELLAGFNDWVRCQACSGNGFTYRHIPMVVENVKGAQPWVGRAKWHYGSYYLWGDVPALMPTPESRVLKGGCKKTFRKNGSPSPHFTDPAEDGIKQHGSGAAWFDNGLTKFPSKSARRKHASALIAKIPFPLARHIAQCYKTAGVK